MIYTEDRDVFERQVVGWAPRLRDMNTRFMGGMCDADRTAFLEVAIDAAWEHRQEFKPRPGYSFPQYWLRCLKYAATSREKWLVSVGTTLPGVFEKRWVLSRMLGE